MCCLEYSELYLEYLRTGVPSGPIKNFSKFQEVELRLIKKLLWQLGGQKVLEQLLMRVLKILTHQKFHVIEFYVQMDP